MSLARRTLAEAWLRPHRLAAVPSNADPPNYEFLARTNIIRQCLFVKYFLDFFPGFFLPPSAGLFPPPRDSPTHPLGLSAVAASCFTSPVAWKRGPLAASIWP